ncbi:MAG TPA: VIT domain-containing protein, partial [Gemmataceae bacterium]|nr:VIT domain-containing protein [Gemmataceae bacterium]
APAVKELAVGEELQTKAGERRRVRLPDGSILYVNAATRATLETPRRLSVAAGEVYVEAAARAPDALLVVRTPNREVTAQRAHFAVRVEKAETSVTVTRGQARVSGLDRPLQAGQQLARADAKPSAAPRASHALDWTRELLIAAESPLVPASKHAGGALIARDPDGQEAKISLRKFHVDVHIEDGFARTTIDQTYFNSSPWQLEGTFYFPLPPDASLSRLAMYVEGEDGLCQLMEGGMAEAGHARQVYETIRYANRDPALLEWLDGSTFKMRVFPLEGRKEKRLLLSYTQRLSTLYDRTDYRFPAGHNLQSVDSWSFQARVKGGADLAWQSPSHTLTASKDGTDLLLNASAQKARVDRDVVLSLNDSRQAAREGIARFSTAEQEQGRYLMLRYRPTLTAEARPQRRDWVFLCETSGDRDPLLARVQIDIIRHLLSKAEPDDTFNVLAAGTRTRPFAKAAQKVTPENMQAALTFLENAHLVGALDLGRALTEAAALLKDSTNPCLVHVGSGIAAMGERRQDVLVSRIPQGAQYVGVGVGRRWNRALMKAAAEARDGLFAQVNPDEPITWRAFELSATLNTPRLQNVTVEDDTGKAFLCYTTALAQGEELAALTRVGSDAALPKKVVVRGRLGGRAFEQVLAVRDPSPRADYLPREWAKLEIERLLTEDARKHRERIVELSKAMYVMTPFTSLLVLENEDLYTQYKVDRGRKDHWALYKVPAKIPAVYEPDPEQPDPKLLKSGQKLPAKQVLQTIVTRQRPGFLTESRVAGSDRGNQLPEVQRIMGAIELGDDVVNLSSPVRFPAPTPEARNEFGAPILSKVPYANRMFANQSFQREDLLRQLREEEEEGRPRGKVSKSDPTTRRMGLNDAEPMKAGEILIAGESLVRERALGLMKPGRAGGVVYALGRPPTETPPMVRFLAPEGVDGLVSTLVGGSRRMPSLLHERPTFRDDPRHFFDLIAYAPGMDTHEADVLAVLEAEALPHPASRPGKIDAAARALLDRARVKGWRTLKVEETDQTPYTIAFDGKGRYAYERELPLGLRERVVCDGQTLFHLYPQLSVGARRSVSRFHRADLFDAIPQAIPPAEDLARGADLKAVGERTVAVIPHGADTAKTADGKPATYARVHLVFGVDGRLTERQIVRMPKGETLYREQCASDGSLRVLDAKGKELLTRKGTLAPAQAPNLNPETKDLVVLPLPYRTREHVRRTLKIEKQRNQELRFADALHLLAADLGQNNAGEALALFRQALHSRDQRQLGLYVLLAACGVNLDAQNADVLAEHLDAPVAQYLALHSSPVLRKHASQWAVASANWG